MNLRTAGHFSIALHTFITNKGGLSNHLFWDSGRALWRTGNDVCNLSLGAAAK